MSLSHVENCDNMDFMRIYPDKFFDLAIIDPPYGISETSYRDAAPGKNAAAKKKDYHTELWKQEKPSIEYWNELFRVSKNQIVWGGNYFTNNLSESRCWLIWDKCTQDSLFADVEMAWTSFQNSAKLFTYRWNGMLQQDMKNKEIRIHPTHKPIALYTWILKNCAKPGFKILDTHLGGGGSSRIASYDLGYEFYGCELDNIYFEAQEKRFNIHISQPKLFAPMKQQIEQNQLW